MDFFDTFKEKATDLAQTGVATSKRLAEIAKLKVANMGEEDTIKRAYLELGKLYYAEHGATPDGAYAAACEKITAACEKITAARAVIETNNDRIAELKATAEAEGEVIDVTPVSVEDAKEEEEISPEDIADEEAPAQEEEAPKTEE